MKKFLSLMLAMIMVMSLVTVGAGAFSDDADITKKEAVALLSGLGIIGGYDDGSFNPTGSLSRGAAAKIIAWMSVGTAKVEAMADKGVAEKPFPDVRLDSSYAVFVEYCKEQGIIGGYDDGNFLPYADLSGHAFIKMALVALGVTDIDFTVKGWQVDAVAKADKMGLLKGIDTTKVALNLALSRENACQIAFNALQYTPESEKAYVIVADATNASAALKALAADKNVYESRSEAMADILIVDKDAVYGTDFTVEEKATTSLAAKNFGLKVVKGTVTANALTDNTLKATETKVEGAKYNFASDLSLFGHEVTVYVNDAPAKAADKNVYAVYDRSKTLSVTKDTTTLKEINAALGATTTTVAVAVADDFTRWDGNLAVDETAFDLATSGTATNKAKLTGTVIITDKKVSGFIAPTAKYLSEVTEIKTDAGKETITLKGLNGDAAISNGKIDTATEKAVDVVKEYEGIAKGDLVVVTKVGAFYQLEKVTTVSGKVTKINDKKVTINGVEYAKNDNEYVTLTNERTAAQMDFTSEYTLYLDTTGKYFTASVKTEEFTYVYVVKGEEHDTLINNKLDKKVFAIGVTMDGTVGEYMVDYNTKTAFDTAKPAGLYKATVDSKGFYTFDNTGIIAADVDGVAKADKNYKPATETYYYDDAMKFVAISYNNTTEKYETEVRTGKQVVTATQGVPAVYYTATEVKDANGNSTHNWTITAAVFEGDFTDDNELKDIVYAVETKNSLVKVPFVDGQGVDQVGYQHTVYVNGVKTTIIVKNDDNTTSAYAMNGFYTLTKNGEGYKVAAKNDQTGALIKVATVSNVYGTLITAGQGALADLDASEAEIVDVTGNSTKVTTLAGLKDKAVALVIDKAQTQTEEDKVVTIYVVKGIDGVAANNNLMP